MMHNRLGVGAALVCVAASLLMAPYSWAQPPEQRLHKALAAAGSDKDAREMVELVMMVRLSKELKLTEDETVLLVRRMSDIRGKMGKLHRERRNVITKLRNESQKGGDGPDEEVIRTSLESLKKLDARIGKAKLEMHEKLSEGLDARQQAQLYLFLQDFEENMRRMVQRVRERGMALEGGRMGRDGAGRGGPPPQRMLRERLPRGPQGREEVDRPNDASPPPPRDAQPGPS